jgi:hypothetical protein
MSVERADAGDNADAEEKPAAGKDEKPAGKKTGIPKESPKCNLTRNEILTACPQNLEPNCVPVESERLVQAPYPGLLNCSIPNECRCISGRYRHPETNNCVLFTECPPKKPKEPKGPKKGPKDNEKDAGGKEEGGNAPEKEGGASNGAPGGAAPEPADDASAANKTKKQQGKEEKKPSDAAAPAEPAPADAAAAAGGSDGGSA